jgi:hypothetical protein
MARRDDDRNGTQVPEADRLEQQQHVDPRAGPDQEWPDRATPDVDEADLLDQAHVVLADPDEEYTPNPP